METVVPFVLLLPQRSYEESVLDMQWTQPIEWVKDTIRKAEHRSLCMFLVPDEIAFEA